MTECALWYERYAHPGFQLCEDEQEAAYAAYYMIEANNAAPTGVQFSDGRTIRFGDWPVYDEIERRIWAEEKDQIASFVPSPTRTVRDPFTGGPVQINADSPGWVGVSPEGVPA